MTNGPCDATGRWTVTEPTAQDKPITIKKYANRRLYNTATSSYVTLDHLSQMVKDGVDFVVFDAKSGDDITRSVLAQIIFEQESRGQSLLPIQFLRQLISFYGDSLQSVIPGYLEMSMDSFSRQQDRWRDQFQGGFDAGQTFGLFEEQARQNMALFERAMRLFAPFASTEDAKAQSSPTGSADADTVADLKRQVEAMRDQLDRLSQNKTPDA
ncbi:MAG: polyhydroxyalkanoate synthesis repressor PhaR [Maricaulaceae bacterium]